MRYVVNDMSITDKGKGTEDILCLTDGWQWPRDRGRVAINWVGCKLVMERQQ